MNDETSPNRYPCSASSRSRNHGSSPQEIIQVILEGWFGFRRRCPNHFFFSGWGLGGLFFALGRFRGHEIRLIIQISAANPLPILSGFIGFHGVLSGSMSEYEICWKIKKPLYLSGFQSKKKNGLGGTRTHNQRLKRALLYH